MSEPIKFCEGCYWWQELTAEHLCEQGSCYLDKNNVKSVTRNNYCDNYQPEDGENVLEK